jgi:hypothetical protein
MKIWKSCYRNHWISPYTVLEHIFFWTAWSKCGRNRGVIEDKDYVDHPAWVERATKYIEPACRAVKWVLDLVHPPVNIIRIDPYDTWSMDHTLADIILPMLKQLQETKHGAPHVADEDVPEYLRTHMAQPKENEWDTDSLWHMRWDWVLAEMIWAFEQKVADDAESQFFEHEQWDELPTSREQRKEWIKDINERVSRMKYDEAGHRIWLDRKSNGFRLMGKYWEALWD